jgi:hypothetical protein
LPPFTTTSNRPVSPFEKKDVIRPSFSAICWRTLGLLAALTSPLVFANDDQSAGRTYTREESVSASRFGVVLGQPYTEVRKALAAGGWSIELPQGQAAENVAFDRYREIVCGHGLDPVCSVRVTRDGEDWIVKVDGRQPELTVIGFWSDTIEAPPSVDTRCFVQADKNSAPVLRLRTYRDSATDWIGGYARYGTSREALPLVLESEVELDAAGDRPSRIRMTWREFVGGKPAGAYETTSQGGFVEGLRYMDATGQRRIAFEPSSCPWT